MFESEVLAILGGQDPIEVAKTLLNENIQSVMGRIVPAPSSNSSQQTK